MKKLLFFFSVIILTACSNEAQHLSGDYSYKTSGYINIKTPKTEYTYKLPNKIGQLNVIDLKTSNKDSILLMFNEMGGDLHNIRARISGDSIFLHPYIKTYDFYLFKDTINLQLRFKGMGTKYNDIIYIEETCTNVTIGAYDSITIKDSKIETMAERNL